MPDPSGYILSVCALFSIFCFMTPHFIFMILANAKNWYGSELAKNISSWLFFGCPACAYFLLVILLSSFREQIEQIPFWLQITAISIFGLIDFLEFIVIMCLYDGFCILDNDKGGGVGNTYFGDWE